MAEVERVGIRVDEGYLASESRKVEGEILDLKRKIQADAVWGEWSRRFGLKAKLSSRKQMATVVFDSLGHPRRHGAAKKDRANDFGGRRQPEYDEAAFQDVDLQFVRDYFRWQKLEKLKGTYLDGISREMVGGRIHPFFHLHKVITYRSSSSEINFQNIPNRNAEIARRIRRCFVPDPGCMIVEIDYSGAEVRSACTYCLDPRLISDFTEKDKDPHGDTAREIFGLPEGVLPKAVLDANPEVEKAWKKTMRDWTKNRFVFPEFFGSVYFQCAPHIWEAVTRGTAWSEKQKCWEGREAAKVPGTQKTVRQHLLEQGIKELGDPDPKAAVRPGTFIHRVRQVEDGFWNRRFSVYTAWKKGWWNRYLAEGWFRTHSGFVIAGLFGRNDVLNYPIQAFAFHWLLASTVEIMRRLRKSRMRTKILGQIHDALLASVPAAEAQDYIAMAVEVMTQWCPTRFPAINVPLSTEVEVCHDSWAVKRVAHHKGGRWEV